MLRWLLHKVFTRLGDKLNYDTSYMHTVTEISPGAALRYFGLPLVSQTQGPSVEVWAGASLASVLDGDCGPCAQLVVDGAVAAGVSGDALRACLLGDFAAAGDVALGYAFAKAAITDSDRLDELRENIAGKHGEEAVVSAAYAAAVSRAYPVLKRGLGFGKLCQQLKIDGTTVDVSKATLDQTIATTDGLASNAQRASRATVSA